MRGVKRAFGSWATWLGFVCIVTLSGLLVGSSVEFWPVALFVTVALVITVVVITRRIDWNELLRKHFG